MSRDKLVILAVVGWLVYRHLKKKKIADAQLDILGLGETAIPEGGQVSANEVTQGDLL